MKTFIDVHRWPFSILMTFFDRFISHLLQKNTIQKFFHLINARFLSQFQKYFLRSIYKNLHLERLCSYQEDCILLRHVTRQVWQPHCDRLIARIMLFVLRHHLIAFPVSLTSWRSYLYLHISVYKKSIKLHLFLIKISSFNQSKVYIPGNFEVSYSNPCSTSTWVGCIVWFLSMYKVSGWAPVGLGLLLDIISGSCIQRSWIMF